LIRADNPARGVNACLIPFSAIEIHLESVLGYVIEDKLLLSCIRRLQPDFNVFRDAKRIEQPGAVRLEPEGKGDVPLILAGDHRDYSRVNQDVLFSAAQSVHFVSPRPQREKAFRLPYRQMKRTM